MSQLISRKGPRTLGMGILGVGLVGLVWTLGCSSTSSQTESATPASAEPAASDSAAAPSADPEPASGQGDASSPGKSGKSAHKGPSSSQPPTTMEEIMQVHFRDAELIRTAVIEGRPKDASRLADEIEHLFDGVDVPKSWAQPVERLQRSAQRLDDSSDIGGIAAATADLGVSCGACHQTVGGPSVRGSEAPPEGATLRDTMRRHAWAIDRLWEGLYIPSDASWRAGAKLLAEEPFSAKSIDKGGVYAKSAATTFHKAAQKARTQQGPDGRASAFAELLTTCAVCHIALQDDAASRSQ